LELDASGAEVVGEAWLTVLQPAASWLIEPAALAPVHAVGFDVAARVRRARVLPAAVDDEAVACPSHEDVQEAAQANGLEGVMAKRLDSRYLPGKRSPAWRTMCRRQDGVIDVVDGRDPHRWAVWMRGCVKVSVT
jgi:hypothetical protein